MKIKAIEEIENALQPVAEELGIEIVEVEFKQGKAPALTVYIDTEAGVDLNTCEKFHRAIDPILDEVDPTFGVPYTLNVSSPGLDRPLKTDRDYQKCMGEKVEVKLFAPLKGKKLFEAVKPDISLHTGDRADEVKVGRMPETREEYLYKSEKMIGILKNSGARVIIVPGNNDLPEEIKRIAPFAEVYPRDTVLLIDGEECRISHEVHKITYDKKWHFYGHGYTGEEWAPEKNVPGAECRFNACECTYVVSISENKYFFIDNPEKF